jgi:transcription elongation regulator 1
MTEEDIMWQLQQMEPEEEEEEVLQGDEAEPLTENQQPEEQDQKPSTDTKPKQNQLSEQECITKFNELLQERNISPFALYTTEYPKLMTDPRFARKV